MVFQFIPFIVKLAISVALMTLSYLLTPQPKQPKAEVKELAEPTASAGRPIPVVFGTIRVRSPNILWYGEKTTRTYKVSA